VTTTRIMRSLLALLVALAVLPPVSQADEDEQPDLQIEVVGLNPGSQRDVLVRVTNVSAWWSDRTVVTVETIAPTPGQVATVDVPDLNTMDEAPLPHVFEFTYTLADDCNRHVVKASVSAGTNYEGVYESKLDNNVAQREVCPKSPSFPAGVSPPAVKPERVTPGTSGPARSDVTFDDDAVTPGGPPALVSDDPPALFYGPMLANDTTSQGTHTATLALNVSMRRGAHTTFHGGFHSAACFPVVKWNLEPRFVVGWADYEWFGSPCSGNVYQVAVSFDRGVLGQVPAYTTVDRVVLAYDEVEMFVEMFVPFCNEVIPGSEDPNISPNCWRSGDGKPEPKPNGCVVVRVPSAEWRHNEIPHGLVPFESDPRGPAVKQVSPREWDVTEPYRWQNVPSAMPLTPPGETPPGPGFGFLLTGSGDINELQGEDSTSCVSWVSNVRLNVTYTVPPDNGPGPIVR
jgi:hypothetical protein